MLKRIMCSLLLLGVMLPSVSTASESIKESKFDKLRKQCVDKRNGASCFKLANFIREGEGENGDERPDFFLAVKYYKKGCKLKNADSCLEIGKCYDKGKALPKSKPHYTKFMEKACHLGSKEACDEVKNKKSPVQ